MLFAVALCAVGLSAQAEEFEIAYDYGAGTDPATPNPATYTTSAEEQTIHLTAPTPALGYDFAGFALEVAREGVTFNDKTNMVIAANATGSISVKANYAADLATMGVEVFDAAKTYDGQPTNVTYVVTNASGDVIADATILLREKGTDVWGLAANFTSYVDTTNVTVEVKAEKAGFTTASNEATVVILPQSADGISMLPVTDTFIYGGDAKKPTPGVTNETLGVMLDSGTDFDYGWESNTNAGTAKVIATLKGNYVGAVTNEFTINKASATIASGSYEWTYDSKPHAYTNLTVEGFVTGEGLATTSDWATITNVGTNDNAFTFTLRDGTLESNYALTVTTGEISVVRATLAPEANPDKTWPGAGVDPEDLENITNPTIPFSCFDTTNVYDGVAHTIDTNALVAAYTEDVFLDNAPSFSYALSSNGTYEATAPAFTDVTVTSVWYKVSAPNFEDVIHPAKVIITNRCVTLTSGSQTWSYDAQAHSNMTVTAEGFVDGEGVSTNDFATITDVGSVPNAFSYEFLDGTQAENYSVTCVTGTLTIAGYFVEYNGSGADGTLAVGTMETNTFGSGIETNLTRCAFTLENFVFSGWTTNGVDKAYDDEQKGKNFAQPGETLSLTALWTRVIVPVTVTNLAHTTVSVATNDVPVDLFKTVDGCGIYNVQTNADVTIVYRADSGWAFDASGTNGTVVLSNVTYDVERGGCFVPEKALPTVVPIEDVITIQGDPAIITNCQPTADGVLIIPATIGGKRVVAIADKAFQYATWLKELVIEEGLTEIGNAAFDNCSGLERVVIPASVKKIGQCAFMRCFALKALEFAGDAPAMQKLPKLGYGICWGAHGFDVKTVPGTKGWDVALNTLCEGWQTFSGPVDGVYTCDYDSTKVKPRITGVKWLSSGSKLTVNNVKPGLTYTLQKSVCLGADWEPVGDSKTGGETDTLEFEIPCDPGTSAFFRVKVSDGSYK